MYVFVFKITLENQINVLWYLLLFFFDLNKFQFIQLFQFDQFVKDIGLCGITAFIRPVFLES